MQKLNLIALAVFGICLFFVWHLHIGSSIVIWQFKGYSFTMESILIAFLSFFLGVFFTRPLEQSRDYFFPKLKRLFTYKVKITYDANHDFWIEVPRNKKKEAARLRAENYDAVLSELNRLDKQADIQNEYFRKWKYLKTLATPEALAFFAGEISKFEYLNNGWNDNFFKGNSSNWVDLHKFLEKRLVTLKRYHDEINTNHLRQVPGGG